MDRSQILLSMFDARGKGLEIGPSFNPLLPKSEGHDVDTVDHISAESLREKYKSAAVDVSRIEDVDYIFDGSSLTELIGKTEYYDFCVALHVIEHTVDLLAFLIDCQNLLKVDGTLVLAVPDKRYSFDLFRPLSSTGNVLDAHFNRRSMHSAGKIFDELAYNCTRGGRIAWPRQGTGDLEFFHPLDRAIEMYKALVGSDSFVDIHAWQFTPSSLRLILCDLLALGHIELREKTFREGAEGEFFITLSRTGAGCPSTRLELAYGVLEEQASEITAADEAGPELSSAHPPE